MNLTDCSCSTLPDIIRVDDHEAFVRGLAEIEVGDWVRLVRCPSCGQFWSVDQWDKLQRQFALKIPARDGWRDFDTVPLRKRFLAESLGGTTDEKCIWAGCSARRLRGTVHCLEHLYATGVRE